MSKVLIVGNGAREHAIAKTVHRFGHEIYAVMDKLNPGIAKISKNYLICKLSEFEKITSFESVDLAIIGPEAPLSIGIVDYLEEHLEIPVLGPNKMNARIESSKAFCRTLLDENQIEGNPQFCVCTSLDDVKAFLKDLGSIEVAVKPDVLTGGKGVKVYGDHLNTEEEILTYAEERLKSDGLVVIEEKLVGQEFTLQAFTDGTHFYVMPLVRDYKRAYDGDKGPNTGSMGSYSLEDHTLPYLSETDIENAKKIIDKTLKALKKENDTPYKGVLYGQFIKTEKGVFLLEFNSRFGDPEAMNVLSLLKTDLVDITFSMSEKNLIRPEFETLATVCVYLVPEGYPIKPKADKKIDVPNENEINAELFYASVEQRKDGIYTSKSRAIAVLGKAQSVSQARELAYKDINKITGALYYRSDIAAEVAVEGN